MASSSSDNNGRSSILEKPRAKAEYDVLCVQGTPQGKHFALTVAPNELAAKRLVDVEADMKRHATYLAMAVDLKEAVNKLELGIDSKDTKISDLTSKQQQIEATAAGLQGAIEELLSKVPGLEADKKAAEAQVAYYMGEIEQLGCVIESKQAMEAALQTDKAELQTLVDELVDDKEALLQEKAELQATKDTLVQTVRSLEADIAELEKQASAATQNKQSAEKAHAAAKQQECQAMLEYASVRLRLDQLHGQQMQLEMFEVLRALKDSAGVLSARVAPRTKPASAP